MACLECEGLRFSVANLRNRTNALEDSVLASADRLNVIESRIDHLDDDDLDSFVDSISDATESDYWYHAYVVGDNDGDEVDLMITRVGFDPLADPDRTTDFENVGRLEGVTVRMAGDIASLLAGGEPVLHKGERDLGIFYYART